MTSLLSTFDGARHSHQGVHSSPAASPHTLRPTSQTSLHLAPGHGSYADQTSPHPFTPLLMHQQPFKAYQPTEIALPQPHTYLGAAYPTTAPLPYYPGPAPLFDARGSQPMLRTVSHAHPMHSATDATVSSRYSSSPHSATNEPLPTASFPSFSFTDTDRHINPAVFSTYPMSRSTSGASDAAGHANTRLLTPHFDGPISSNEAELRKVSDTLGRFPSGRFWNHAPSPQFDLASPHFAAPGIAPHPQPEIGIFNNRGWGNDFATSAERGKAEVAYQGETEYERERAQQIMNNRKFLAEVGLGANGQYMRSRNVTPASDQSRNASVTPSKKRVISDGPVRASPRIASQYRNVSYANLDGEPIEEESEEEYSSELDIEEEPEEEEFRPVKRARGGYRGGRKPSVVLKSSRRGDLSLYGLLQVYPDIPHLYPLFYYTLNNDLTINSDSVPLIGSIPSTVTALEKAEMLRGFFHRSRRVLAQLDAFTSRCDRKYDGEEARYTELDQATRVAIRDVRRKVVERCENYKYTRRDILDKHLGKNKWQPIDQGMIEWRVGMTQNDPAGDLSHVSLTYPTPPAGQYPLHRAPSTQATRQIRSLPSRRVSVAPDSARTFSITMGEPEQLAPATAPIVNYTYDPAPPMYGEDQVSMTVNMPLSSTSVAHTSPLSVLPHTVSMLSTLVPGEWENKALKRGREEEECSEHDGIHTQTLWQD